MVRICVWVRRKESLLSYSLLHQKSLPCLSRLPAMVYKILDKKLCKNCLVGYNFSHSFKKAGNISVYPIYIFPPCISLNFKWCNYTLVLMQFYFRLKNFNAVKFTDISYLVVNSVCLLWVLRGPLKTNRKYGNLSLHSEHKGAFSLNQYVMQLCYLLVVVLIVILLVKEITLQSQRFSTKNKISNQFALHSFVKV